MSAIRKAWWDTRQHYALRGNPKEMVKDSIKLKEMEAHGSRFRMRELSKRSTLGEISSVWVTSDNLVGLR